MNSNFYNGLVKIVTTDDINFNSNNISIDVVDDIESALFSVREDELRNDYFYNYIIVLNEYDDTENIDLFIKNNNTIKNDVVYVNEYIPSFIPNKCFVDDTAFIFSSFVSWMYMNSNQSPNNLYGFFRHHRIKMKTISSGI